MKNGCCSELAQPTSRGRDQADLGIFELLAYKSPSRLTFTGRSQGPLRFKQFRRI